MFYTSISYDAGWKAYVDGKRVEVTPVSDAQVAFKVPKGQHEIKLKYTPKGFVLGTILTISALLIFVALILWTEKKLWLQQMFYEKFAKKSKEQNQTVSE